MISHVLDTCAILDLAAGRWTSQSARAAMEIAAEPAILSIAVWEISRKVRLKKLTLPCKLDGVSGFVGEVCRRHEIGIVSLDAETCHLAEMLPPSHEDPFDRMLIAFARKRGIPIFTTDRRFEDYPVTVIRQWD